MMDLYTAATPNGHKVSIALEKLGWPYTLKVLDPSKAEQKKPEFLAINAQRRSRAGPPIFRTGAQDAGNRSIQADRSLR